MKRPGMDAGDGWEGFPRLVLAWAGMGKTSLAAKDDRFVDLENDDYFLSFPAWMGAEERKGDRRGRLNPLWPANFAEAVCAARDTGRVVMSGTRREVMAVLDALGVPYCLVLPDESLKQCYVDRYLSRGNSRAWVEDYMADWDARYREFRDRESLGIPVAWVDRPAYLLDMAEEIIELSRRK